LESQAPFHIGVYIEIESNQANSFHTINFLVDPPEMAAISLSLPPRNPRCI
jgi:hypothetical protein